MCLSMDGGIGWEWDGLSNGSEMIVCLSPILFFTDISPKHMAYHNGLFAFLCSLFLKNGLVLAIKNFEWSGRKTEITTNTLRLRLNIQTQPLSRCKNISLNRR